jgi:hypothetical protein
VLIRHTQDLLAHGLENCSTDLARPVHIDAQATTELVVDLSGIAEEGGQGCFDCRFVLRVTKVDEGLEVLKSILYTIMGRDGSQTHLPNMVLESVCGILLVELIFKDLHEPYRRTKTPYSAQDVVVDKTEGMSCL